MWWLAFPKDQRRITVARCWVHELLPGGAENFSMGFAWNGENFDREVPHNITVRLNYCGPGVAGAPEVTNDIIHHKGSQSIYAFNRFDVPSNHLLSHRFGLRARVIGNYGPTATCRMWDALGWAYGNNYSRIEGPAGRSHYYDDTKNLAGQPNNSVGGFHAHARSRISGNTATIELGMFGNSNNWCFSSGSDPATLPDPLATGQQEEQRAFDGVTYAADPNDETVGVKIRDHSGTVLLSANPPVGCAISSWVQNLDNLPNTAAPSAWLTDLVSEYPWISDICPDPTSLTGGPGGTAPWSIAQALTRGDAANPGTGPFRNSPGGLP
jgi:hypothetical protein